MSGFDVQVLGAGIVGRTLALSLARQGLRVALQGQTPSAADEDIRAYALNPAAVELLRGVEVWDALPAHSATPVYEMAVRGDAHDAEIDFSAWQQRVGALAWITDAARLEQALASAVCNAPRVSIVDGEVEAALTAVCEGRASATRQRLGVAFERHAYGHRAIAARLVTDRRHGGTAHQWFRAPDVLALLPFDVPDPGLGYALVWSLPDARAEALMAAAPAEFEAALAEATGGAAGHLQLRSSRAAWPLQYGRAERWCGPGWVLLGDAAHVVHPLAGQGLNLGLADVATLTRVIVEREPWRPLGDERLLRRYVRERAAPTWAMGQATDGLLRLFSHPSPGLRELRNRGLTLVNRLPLAKRWLAAQALGT